MLDFCLVKVLPRPGPHPARCNCYLINYLLPPPGLLHPGPPLAGEPERIPFEDLANMQYKHRGMWLPHGTNPIPESAVYRGIGVEFKPATPDSFATAILVANRPEHPGLQRLIGITTDPLDQSWLIWETLPSVFPRVLPFEPASNLVALRSIILQVMDLVAHLNRHRLVHQGLYRDALSIVANKNQEEKRQVEISWLVSLGNMWRVCDVDAPIRSVMEYTMSTQACSFLFRQSNLLN
jgi:hypothetical protein